MRLQRSARPSSKRCRKRRAPRSAAGASFRVPATRATAKRSDRRFAEGRRFRPSQEGLDGRVERIEILAKSQDVKLIAPVFDGLGQRHPDAAALVAQETQQANGGPAQLQRRIEIRGHVRGSKNTASPATTSTRGQTAWPGLMSRFSWRHPIVSRGHEQQPGGDEPSGVRPCRPSRRPTIGIARTANIPAGDITNPCSGRHTRTGTEADQAMTWLRHRARRKRKR